jgi:hypothetical protein
MRYKDPMPIIAEIGRLLDSLEGLVGKRVAIDESISRDRARGHDRHWSTASRFEFVVARSAGTISGAQLILEGDGMWYAMAADAITSAIFEPNLIIAEQVEHRTERQTTIRVI